MIGSVRSAARAIVEGMRRQYSAPHTVVPANEEEFGHLDLKAYANFKSELVGNDFSPAGDFEILEVSNSPGTLLARTFIRNMISKDGQVLAQYYQVKPRVWRRTKLLLIGLCNFRFLDAPLFFWKGLATHHCVGFETEFQDGRQLITSNAEEASIISNPPSIETLYFPYGTPVSVLYEHHLAKIGQMGGTPLALRSVNDVLAMQQRQSELKVAYRAAVQWVTQQEMQGFAAGNEDLSEAVFAEVQRLFAEERGEA